MSEVMRTPGLAIMAIGCIGFVLSVAWRFRGTGRHRKSFRGSAPHGQRRPTGSLGSRDGGRHGTAATLPASPGSGPCGVTGREGWEAKRPGPEAASPAAGLGGLGRSDGGQAHATLHDTAVWPDGPDELDEYVTHALARDPAFRAAYEAPAVHHDWREQTAVELAPENLAMEFTTAEVEQGIERLERLADTGDWMSAEARHQLRVDLAAMDADCEAFAREVIGRELWAVAA